MRRMRRVGAVAVVGAVVMLVGGCSDDDEPESEKPPKAAASASPEPTEEASLSPEQQIDAKAAEEGWIPGEAAGPYVADICESLPQQKEFGDEAAWLKDRTDAEHGEVLRFGVPLLCPEWVPPVERALGGDVARSYGAGTYKVVSGNGSREAMAAGRYRASGDLEDCYWERARRDGTIVDNEFARAAKSVEVTVRAGELFTSEGCGAWRPVS